MKKNLFLLFSLNLTLASLTFAQLSSGTVKFQITAQLNESSRINPAMLPKEQIIDFNKNYIKIVTASKSPIQQFQVFDLANNDVTSYIDLPAMGKKHSIKIKRPKASGNFVETGKTKEVAGYACKEAIINVAGTEITVYFTRDFAVDFIPETQEKGFALEYTMPLGKGAEQGKLIFTASEVISKKHDDAFFLPGDAYVPTTQQQLMQELMNSQKVENNKIEPGKPAIQFSQKDRAGTLVDLNQLKGKVVVLNFWFSACKPCVVELPHLNKLVKRYNGRNVEFIAITFDDASKVDKFIAQYPMAYRVIQDASSIIRQYGVSAFPTHVVIGPDGTILKSIIGGADIENRLAKVIDSVL